MHTTVERLDKEQFLLRQLLKRVQGMPPVLAQLLPNHQPQQQPPQTHHPQQQQQPVQEGTGQRWARLQVVVEQLQTELDGLLQQQMPVGNKRMNALGGRVLDAAAELKQLQPQPPSAAASSHKPSSSTARSAQCKLNTTDCSTWRLVFKGDMAEQLLPPVDPVQLAALAGSPPGSYNLYKQLVTLVDEAGRRFIVLHVGTYIIRNDRQRQPRLSDIFTYGWQHVVEEHRLGAGGWLMWLVGGVGWLSGCCWLACVVRGLDRVCQTFWELITRGQ